MKNVHRVSLQTLGLALGLGLAWAPAAVAGPGPQYWQTAKLPVSPAPAIVPPAASSVQIKNDWPNGRGPLVAKEVANKSAIPLPHFVVMKPDWPNGRGPLHPVEVSGTILHGGATAHGTADQ